MASRKLGYRPDPPDKRDLNALSLPFLAAAELPRAHTLRPLVQQVLDQGSTSSCVAHAFAQAICVAEHYVGITLPLPSRLYIYANARKQHSTILTDDGTYLRSAANGLAKLGAPPEVDWPFSTSWLKVNRMPPFQAFMSAHSRRGGGYFRISEQDDARITAVKRAIASGLPVTFGTQVSHKFLDATGSKTITKPETFEPIAGGHAMCIVGYETLAQGTLFEVVNSWGQGWRDNGFFRMTDEYLCWSFTSDLWCVRGWEAVRDVA